MSKRNNNFYLQKPDDSQKESFYSKQETLFEVKTMETLPPSHLYSQSNCSWYKQIISSPVNGQLKVLEKKMITHWYTE